MFQKASYFPHIDGLRTFAVIGVLLAHFHIPGFPGGFLGVDVFFVISGFLITRLIIQERGRTGRFSYGRFYVRRIRRLMPAALAVIALSILAFYPVLGDKDLVSFLRSVPFAIFSLANVNFYREVGYFDSAAQFKPLLHTWSLAVEEQFYLIWPTLLLILMRFGRWLLPVSLILLIASVVGAELIRSENFSAAYYLLPFRAFELLVGAALATLMAEHSPDRRDIQALPETAMSLMAWAGLALVLGSYFLLSETSALPGLLSLPACLGTALIIAYGAHGGVGRILTWRPVVWIGLISYSLYLVHWPVYVYVAYRLPDMPSLPLRLAMFPISIALAAASYYFIEQPFRHPASKDKRWGNTPFITATLTVAVLACLPTGLYRAFPQWRLPERQAFGTPDVTHVTRTRVPYPGSPTGATMLSYRSPEQDALKVLILGDSHAGHLGKGVEFYLSPQRINVDLAPLTGCPGLFGVTIRYDRLSEACTLNEPARRALALDPSYDAVILSTRWNPFLTDRTFDGTTLSEAVLEPLDAAPDGPPSDLASSRQRFLDSLKDTVEAILAAGKRVVLISQVPALGNDLAQCQSLFPWTRTEAADSERCFRLPLAGVEERSAFADHALQEIAATHPGVMLIAPRDYMCDDTSCLVTDPDTSEYFYRDSNHLDAPGAIWLLQQAEEAQGLVRFLGGHPAAMHGG